MLSCHADHDHRRCPSRRRPSISLDIEHPDITDLAGGELRVVNPVDMARQFSETSADTGTSTDSPAGLRSQRYHRSCYSLLQSASMGKGID